MKPQNRKGSCTSKREVFLEIQERIYSLGKRIPGIVGKGATSQRS
jgi:hypothetical protein